ncbi:THUMP domain-containing protein 3 [Mortierella sp. AD031]|nr:THUMP domain-containing protein 3 [Mortierella sp. AD031]
MESIAGVIADLIDHPPLCIFAAYVSIGEICIPRTLFDSPKDLLDYSMNGFKYTSTQESTEAVSSSSSRSSDSRKQGGETEEMPLGIGVVDGVDRGVGGLRWRQGLSVLQFSPSNLSESLASFLCSLAPTNSAQENTLDSSGSSGATSVRYRASFDRGDVQHKGVRSQDLAAALGGLAGDMFPSWKVNLKEFDIEVMGRWIQEGLEEVQVKPKVESSRAMNARGDTEDEESSNKRPRIEQGQQQGKVGVDFVTMQVGMTLPLALSSCPYRFRPLDGRTSLRIEIAYTILALADPQPGEVVVDTCSGVGTIPIVGAVHYPGSLFTGFEILPFNVERAAQNAIGMMDKGHREERTRSRAVVEATNNVRSYSRPSLLLGDARAVCWRSGSVDLIVSDLPWGKRENSHVYNCKLYPRLIREIIRLLRVNGRAVLITGERKLLQRQLDAPFAKPYLRCLHKREITIGYKVMVFALLRV